MTIAIIDDQKEFLESHCQKLKQIDLSNIDIYTFQSIKDFEEEENHYDLILLDIEMPDCDGIEYAKQYLEYNILFITSQGQRIKDAFGTNIYGFIEKNDSAEYFINKVKETLELIENENYITLNTLENKMKFKKKDILYVQFLRHTTLGFLYHEKNYTLTGYTLKKFKEEFGNKMMFVDKGCMVNQDRIYDIIDGRLYIEGVSQTFQISKRRLKDFHDIIMKGM